MRRAILLVATAVAFSTASGHAFAGSAGGAVLPNADIRALEPPIDVTPEQLRAQGTPVARGRLVTRDDIRPDRRAPLPERR